MGLWGGFESTPVDLRLIKFWAFFHPFLSAGLITLGQSRSGNPDWSPFDREKTDFHYLTVEARDEVGQGNRNTVELLIHLKDVNDNAPRFEQDAYRTFLPENNDQFPSPFLVRADDKDENGTENAQIRYVSNSSKTQFEVLRQYACIGRIGLYT